MPPCSKNDMARLPTLANAPTMLPRPPPLPPPPPSAPRMDPSACERMPPRSVKMVFKVGSMSVRTVANNLSAGAGTGSEQPIETAADKAIQWRRSAWRARSGLRRAGRRNATSTFTGS